MVPWVGTDARHVTYLMLDVSICRRVCRAAFLAVNRYSKADAGQTPKEPISEPCLARLQSSGGVRWEGL